MYQWPIGLGYKKTAMANQHYCDYINHLCNIKPSYYVCTSIDSCEVHEDLGKY